MSDGKAEEGILGKGSSGSSVVNRQQEDEGSACKGLSLTLYITLVAGTGALRSIHFGYISTRILIAVMLPVTQSRFVQRYIIRGLTLGAVKG